MSVNKIILIGFVGDDPESRETPTGKTVCTLSLATNDGKRVNWHKVETWEKTAGIVKQYVKKGSHLYVDGRVDYRTFEKDGVKVHTTVIVAYGIQLLDRKTEETETDDLPF